MFSKTNCLFFIAAGILITTGYLCMALDPVENGFGIPTLWLAPPLLLAGFFLPVIGIIGFDNLKSCISIQSIKRNKLKHITAFAAFLITFLIYLFTLEPTASLWDCSEFIAAAYKLQVPHTPGTPLSLLIGRIFSMLAFGNVNNVAWSVNLMSGLFSALTVYLVYYIIFYFGEKLIASSYKYSNILLILSSLCGSLCLAFSDTFWFSAVEAEIYGLACFVIVLMLWLMLKASDMKEPLKSRWLVLIFYMAGISYCIHPMCLLILPVFPFLWFVTNQSVTFKNVALAGLAGLVIVFLINRFVAVGLFEFAFLFDLFFVNNIQLPFYSGVIVFIIILISLFTFLITRYVRYAAYTWAVVFLLFGFTPYLMLFIRSNHNPPIDESNPENLALIKAYMNRESYPSSPLLYGPYFDAKIEDINIKKKAYYKDGEEYKIAGNLIEYDYEDLRQTVLPRLYSHDANHIAQYKAWTGLGSNEKPRFTHNLKFMLNYQLGHMYLRYLMWNFAGRAGDVQDSEWLKPWDNLNTPGFKEKARNQYWMIPLLLGIAGIVFQFKHNKKGFFTNTIFFLITGIILALYLNSTPGEPRERDYIYAGSYIAFCIWIGLGILSLRYLFTRNSFPFVIGLISVSIPAWMLYQNYDDHNRSGRTFQIDYARNTLSSCAPNAILFTGGDNDTFPLWYLQEVEGFRTDVRVVVLSYFNTDWYINQLRKAYYQSKPSQLTLEPAEYRQHGINDVLYVDESIKDGIDVKKYFHFLKEDHPALKMMGTNGEPYRILPSKTLKITVDEDIFHDTSLLEMGYQKADHLVVKVKGNYLEKNALAVLDLIISNHWKRPLYFNFTSMNNLGLDLKPYLVQEGSVFRLSAIQNGEADIMIDTELTYKNLIENADYGNLANEDIYFSAEDYQARMVVPIRQYFNDLADAYRRRDDNEKAIKVLEYAVEKLYHAHLKPSYTDIHAADLLLSLGRDDLAKKLTTQVFDYYYAQAGRGKDKLDRLDRYLLNESVKILDQLGDTDYLKKIKRLNASF